MFRGITNDLAAFMQVNYDKTIFEQTPIQSKVSIELRARVSRTNNTKTIVVEFISLKKDDVTGWPTDHITPNRVAPATLVAEEGMEKVSEHSKTQN